MVVQPASEVSHVVEPDNKIDILGLRPSPVRFTERAGRIQLAPLKKLAHSSVLSADFFDAAIVCELCKVAALLQADKLNPKDVLEDKILAAAFFEPSTRTRLSFESAMLHLGGKTLSVAEAATTGIAKGESLRDIGQMFNSYADILVMRHTEQRALQDLSEYLRIPLINGGNGSDEHPTQALADWYALLKWKPGLAFGALEADERVHIGIVGTPGSMRTVKSFLILSLLFKKNVSKITIISEMADPLGEDVKEFVESSPVKIEFSNDLQDVISDLDIIYMNSIAFLGDGYRKLGEHFQLDAKTPLKKNAVILHPLARGEELDVSLDDTRHNLYFNQADGAVYLRQALLLAVFDRLDSVFPNDMSHASD